MIKPEQSTKKFAPVRVSWKEIHWAQQGNKVCFYLVASAPLKEVAIVFKLSNTYLRGIFLYWVFIREFDALRLSFCIFQLDQTHNIWTSLIFTPFLGFFWNFANHLDWQLLKKNPNPVFLIAQSAQEAFMTCQHDFYCSCTMKTTTSHWLIPLPWGAGLTSIPLEIPTWIPMNAKIFKDTGICSVKTEIMHITYRCCGTVGVVEAYFQKGSTETIL